MSYVKTRDHCTAIRLKRAANLRIFAQLNRDVNLRIKDIAPYGDFTNNAEYIDCRQRQPRPIGQGDYFSLAIHGSEYYTAP